MSYIPSINQKVTINSSGSWTCPAGVFWALLTMWAGGGGGYLQTDNSTYLESGGGGGGQWKQMLIPVVPGTTYNFVIGAGGTGYVSFTNTPGSPTAGGNSYMYTSAAQTTLGAAISGTSNGNITLAAVSGLANGSIIQVDSEMLMILNLGTAGTSNTYVIRGWNGTTGATHSNSATVNLLNIIALVLGGGPAGQQIGGNGGGADGFSGGGANNGNPNGAGTGKSAQNGRGGTGAGGGAYSSTSAFNSPAGSSESPLGFAFPNYQLTSATFGGFASSGGASWGPGVIGGDYTASSVISPPANTGGGGGSGAAGSSGGALLAYQGA